MKTLDNLGVCHSELLFPQLRLHEQLVEGQAVHGREVQGPQPLRHLPGLEGLCGPLPFEVMAPQDFVDLIQSLRAFPHEPLPQLGQMPVRLLLRAWHKHGPYPLDSISAQQTVAIDPQQLAQGVRVAPVGLGGRSPQRLDHQHPLAAIVLLQPFHQPVVKSADLHDGDKLLAGGSRLLQLAAKLIEFRPAGADLTTKDHVAVLVA